MREKFAVCLIIAYFESRSTRRQRQHNKQLKVRRPSACAKHTFTYIGSSPRKGKKRYDVPMYKLHGMRSERVDALLETVLRKHASLWPADISYQLSAGEKTRQAFSGAVGWRIVEGVRNIGVGCVQKAALEGEKNCSLPVRKRGLRA